MFFNLELLELHIEIAELYALDMEDEELIGFLENFWIWDFKKGNSKYDIQ